MCLCVLLSAGLDNSWKPNHSLFSPLTGYDSPPPVTTPPDHTPLQLTPPISTSEHTPSPLTIEAQDICSLSREREEENSLSLSDSHPAVNSSGQKTLDSIHQPCTLSSAASYITPPPDKTHPVAGTTGHIKIKISARKLREVSSPLTTPPSKDPHHQSTANSHVSDGGRSESGTPRALKSSQPPHLSLSSSGSFIQPSPSPSLSHFTMSQPVEENPAIVHPNDGEFASKHWLILCVWNKTDEKEKVIIIFDR